MSILNNAVDDTLHDRLVSYTSCGVYPMHMPGHKRNGSFFPGLPGSIDVTEINGFDNLTDAHDVLRETSDIASQLYGSGKAFLLINGSTAGVLAAIGALTRRGGKILMARNCHMSVYNAVALFGLLPAYIMPEIDGSSGIFSGILPSEVEIALKDDPGIELVVITSPTYEGVVSDVREIARITHARGVPLFVDCAHGAHFGFSPAFPESPVSAGADAVVMSLHKTLPALTQCSLLHVSGGLADAGEAARLVNVFQTSSPSYILLSSIDRCLRTLRVDSEQLFMNYEKNLSDFYSEVSSMKNLRLLQNPEVMPGTEFYAYDHGKIVVLTGGAAHSRHAAAGSAAVSQPALTGTALMNTLRDKYKIEMETAGLNYTLAMTSICDTAEGFRRLADALNDIDKSLDHDGPAPLCRSASPNDGNSVSGAHDGNSGCGPHEFNSIPGAHDGNNGCGPHELNSIPGAHDGNIGPCVNNAFSPAAYSPARTAFRAVLPPSDALSRRGKFIALIASAGFVSLEYIYAYPPGIPIIVPGELITEEVISYCTRSFASGCALKSTKGQLPECIYAAPPDYL